MKDETIITVGDLFNLYSGDIIYIIDESGRRLYYGSGYFCELRLKLCSVSKFCFSNVGGYFVLFITLKGLKND